MTHAFAAVALSLSVGAASAGNYRLELLDNFNSVPGSRSYVYGIAPGGVVLGQSIDDAPPSQIAAVRWNGLQPTRLPAAGAGANAALAGNAAGVTVGEGRFQPSSNPQPVVWRADGSWDWLQLPTGPGQSMALAVNAGGVIAGYAEWPGLGWPQPTLWTEEVPAALPLPDGAVGGAVKALNDDGIAGGSLTISSTVTHAAVWIAGSPLDLGTLGGPRAVVSAVNRKGWLVGWSDTSDGSYTRPFYWTGNGLVELPTLDGTDAWATGINSKGQIVGYARRSGSDRAVIWINGSIADLNKRIDPMVSPKGWRLISAQGIDSAGRIAGMAVHRKTKVMMPYLMHPL
ncbi:hypothetical protein KAK06_13095 [Ideonella sp. 4Y11]|uniref:HAF repeat-containing protein n=1 Tax=Ideonella aquatica TaxID=2824119 RepID=A0A940YJL8_9BURK|nr:hypothetical protein [Ideonella aquatica]MBQ0959882.1 hypothetical protein [Ideonella aquatica]